MLISKKKNWCVVSVQLIRLKEVYKLARCMEMSSLNLNASFVVHSLNGFVGEILISVSHAIRNSVLEIMYLVKRKKNFLNVQVRRLVL